MKDLQITFVCSHPVVIPFQAPAVGANCFVREKRAASAELLKTA
jgi:hypothetical protein